MRACVCCHKHQPTNTRHSPHITSADANVLAQHVQTIGAVLSLLCCGSHFGGRGLAEASIAVGCATGCVVAGAGLVASTLGRLVVQQLQRLAQHSTLGLSLLATFTWLSVASKLLPMARSHHIRVVLKARRQLERGWRLLLQ